MLEGDLSRRQLLTREARRRLAIDQDGSGHLRGHREGHIGGEIIGIAEAEIGARDGIETTLGDRRSQIAGQGRRVVYRRHREIEGAGDGRRAVLIAILDLHVERGCRRLRAIMLEGDQARPPIADP